MPNITTDDSVIVTLNTIEQIISRYGYIIIFILGNIGSLLNILVLSQHHFRRNSCSSYILASTVPNLLIINIVILFRILMTFSFDPTNTSTFFCKFLWYILHSMTLLSRTYILLACIDRWLMTSPLDQRRAFAHITVSIFVIPITAIIWCLVSIHVLIFQDNTAGRCISDSIAYSVFFNIFNTILPGLLIPILMIMFGVLTIENLKQVHNLVNPHMHTHNQELSDRPHMTHQRSADYQLLFMVLVQQCVYVITTLPLTIYSVYAVITINSIKSHTKIAIESLCSSIGYILVLSNFCVTFYIYILISHSFRKKLKRIIFHNDLMNMIFGVRLHHHHDHHHHHHHHHHHRHHHRPIRQSEVPMHTLHGTGRMQ